MRVLGIETSCDETAAAVVDSGRVIHSNVVWSQLEEHAAYGGVVPEIAARAHAHCIEEVVTRALKEANTSFDQLDGIAVTSGPGLIGGVIVGVMVAKALTSVHKLPLIGVNHLEGHALTVRMTDDLPFPYLLFLASGGHCQLLEVAGLGKYTTLGATMDDALGEAFDKTAKMLGLGYPGGPAVERYAKEGDPHRIALPHPLKGRSNSDLSFSGMKTAVREAVLSLANAQGGELSHQDKADICASFQHAIGVMLEERLLYGIEMFREHHPDGRHFVMAGGVAANQYLREKLTQLAMAHGLVFVAPPVKLCTDNAAMIAWAGIERLKAGQRDPLTIEPRARWPLAELA